MAQSWDPDDIDAILAKAGPDWTPEEPATILGWLQSSRHRWLLAISSRCFRRGITKTLGKVGRPVPHIDASHVEDVVAEFFVSRFHGVVQKYRPSKHRKKTHVEGFSAFLATGLCWFAGEQGEKFGRRVFDQPPVTVDSDGDEVAVEPPASGLSPEDEAILDQQVAHLKACIKALPPALRLVMELVLRDLTNEEIAVLLILAVGTVKNRKSLALPILRDCLIAKGVTIGPGRPIPGGGE